MGHRVIYVEKSEYLRLYLDNLKVEVKDNDILFPIADIQILVIDNYKLEISDKWRMKFARVGVLKTDKTAYYFD